MSNIPSDKLIELLPSTSLKILVLLFLVLNKELQAKLFKHVEFLFKQAIKYFLILNRKLAEELKELKAAIPKPNQKSKRRMAWGTIGIYVIFSAYLFIEGIVFLIFATIFAIYDEISIFKFLLAGGMIILLWVAAWFFRAGAHKTANENGINKFLWR